MSKWKEIELGKACTKIGSGATPKGGNESYKSEGISLIRSQNILDFYFSYDGLAFIDENQAKELDNVEVKEEDVLINITGDSVARVCMVPTDILPARVNQHVAILRTNKDCLLPKYLKYYLLSPLFKKSLLNLASSGATRNALTKGMLENILICLPDITEQKAIADVLSCLDDKIELLQKQNKTLEDIAQALFKRWFVDFEFLDEKGKPYKSSGGKMVDSELGKIPEGWEIGVLGNVLELCYGKGLKEDDRDKGQYPVIGSSGIVGCHKDFFVSGPGIVVGRKGNVGTILWIHLDFYPIDTTFYVKSTINTEHLFFHYFILKNQDFQKIGSDSAVPGLNREMACQNQIVIPDIHLINSFNNFALPIFNKMKKNLTQIEVLTTAKNSILPKLMSGELRVKI